MAFGQKKPIIVTRPDGSEHEYQSQSAAALVEGISQSDLSEMCRIGRKRNGFTAKFKPDDQPEK